MSYYCYLCNEFHDGSSTEDHFIPRSIDGPEHQWLPVCEASNSRANTVCDNDARDLLFWARFKDTKALSRSGEALLRDGTLKHSKFRYDEQAETPELSAFHYIYDRDTNTQITPSDVYAIHFSVGLKGEEQDTYCKGIAKMSLGALVYLLEKRGLDSHTIRQIASQMSVDAIRHISLDLPWPGPRVEMPFSLGRSDVLARLQGSCDNLAIRNHVITVRCDESNCILIEGMLYSQYGWVLNLSNDISITEHELRLHNPIAYINAPESLCDLTLSQDSICILNPHFEGQKPTLPPHWQESL